MAHVYLRITKNILLMSYCNIIEMDDIKKIVVESIQRSQSFLQAKGVQEVFARGFPGVPSTKI